MDNMFPAHNSSAKLSSDISGLADYVLVSVLDFSVTFVLVDFFFRK